ncbi:MAG: hypothetical protein AAGA99_20430 [Actinomycetota bacterium]
MSKSDAEATEEPARISRDDLEAKLRNVTGEVEQTTEQIRNVAIAVGAAVVVILVLLAFLSGRSRGRTSSTVVEIRRI